MANSIGAAAPPLPLPRGAAATPLPAHARANPADAQRIAQATAQLRATEAGREVAEFLIANRIEVRVMPDPDFAAHYPGAGAVYDPKTRQVTLPGRALSSPALVTTLAHEGKHAMDFADRPHWSLQALGLIGGTAKDGATALVTFRNPVTAWLDSLTARQNEDEVVAYQLQAEVAHQLGHNESRWALGQAPDGSPLPVDEVRANVATNDLYRMDPMRRLMLGAGLGVGVTSAAAFGAQALASKLRPGSYLAARSWPVYAVGGALTAAWILGDQLRARRLEEYASRPGAVATVEL